VPPVEPLVGLDLVLRQLDLEDRVDPAHRLERDRRLGDNGEDEELAPPVAPARGFCDRPGTSLGLVEIAETGIGVGLQDPGVRRQLTPRMAQIAEKTKRYPSDLTDEEWERIAPLMPQPGRRGRPCEVDFREVMNAVRDLVRPGCGW
jgi:hypothetical protein